MASKLSVKLSSKPAVTITRSAVKKNRLVYIAKANKSIKYNHGGRSHIVYIGTTKAGAKRIAQSAASQAENMLNLHGIKFLEFYTVFSKPQKGLKSWRLLERALILRFRERYGKPPRGNVVGKKMKFKDELRYYSRKKLDNIIDKLT